MNPAVPTSRRDNQDQKGGKRKPFTAKVPRETGGKKEKPKKKGMSNKAAVSKT